MRSFEDAVDPDRALDPDERARLVEEARRLHFAELGRKSGKARRDRSDQVAELLARTRGDRGMRLVIDDPAIIAKVASIVAAASTGGDA